MRKGLDCHEAFSTIVISYVDRRISAKLTAQIGLLCSCTHYLCMDKGCSCTPYLCLIIDVEVLLHHDVYN